MKKNKMLKLLSLVVGIMVIVASVVCLTTVNAEDDFGTEADGITVSSKTAMDSWTATEGLKNGDFSEGLKYWGPSNYYGSTAVDAKTSDIVTLDAEGFVKFTGNLSYASAGFQSVPVKVSVNKLQAGDKLAVMYKGDAAPGAAKAKVILWQFNIAAGKDEIVNCSAANVKVYKEIDANWALLNTITTQPVQENATESEFYTFAVEFRATNKTSVARFDDVQIVKVEEDGFYNLDGLKLDENGAPIPGSGEGGEGGSGGDDVPELKDEDYILGGVTSLLPGTEAEGITNPINAGQYSTSANGIHGTVILGLPNGDFEQGLKWWAGKQNCAPLNSAKLVTEGENTYIQFANLDVSYEGFCAPDVGVHTDDLKEGDHLVVIFDHKGSGFQLVFGQRNAAGAQESRVTSQIIKTGDWTTSYIALGGDGKVRERSAGTTPGYASSDYYTFKFVVENKTTDSDAAFDNFRLAIKDGNKFYDLDGNEISFTTGGGEGGEGGEGDDSASDYEKVLMDNGANMPGTEAEGITGKYSNLHASAVLGLNNGDFQKGFKWWAGKQAGGPSSVMDLKTEGENKYVQFNMNKLDAQWKGLCSPDIAIPEQYVKSGDTLAFIYDFKGTDFQVVLAQRNGGTGARMAEGNSNNSTELAVNGEWTTAVAPIKSTVGDRSVGNLVGCEGTGYYTFFIFIENSGMACDAAFDNIRLAKVGTDGAYYDIYTGEKMEFKSTPTGGEGGNGGSTGDSGSTGTGNGNGNGTGNNSSATTGDSFPVMPMAVAGIVIAASAVILRKKVR